MKGDTPTPAPPRRTRADSRRAAEQAVAAARRGQAAERAVAAAGHGSRWDRGLGLRGAPAWAQDAPDR